MSAPSVTQIEFWNRERARFEEEQVYGEGAIKLLYQSRLGQLLADSFLSSRLPSLAYGAYQASSISEHKIKPFIEKFQIQMEEYEDKHFASFNEFFIRKFRSGARPVEAEPSRMAAFAEARYLAFDSVRIDETFPVKGKFLTAELLLGDSESARPFEGGPLLIARLCPTDYHRFHFPDSGRIVREFRVNGKLHSVNPLALRYRGEIFATNEREVTILETDHFGKLAYIEVGALCVGKIIQSRSGAASFERGEEKGYFLFGASTVIVLGEKGRWLPDSDLLEQTRSRRESFVKLGTAIAHRL